MMRKSKFVILAGLSIVVLLIIACDAPVLASREEMHLVGNYYLAVSDSGLGIGFFGNPDSPSGYLPVVSGQLIDYKWNDRYIVAKYHPERDFGVKRDEIVYKIIEICEPGTNYSQCAQGYKFAFQTQDYSEYLEMHRELGLSDELLIEP